MIMQPREEVDPKRVENSKEEIKSQLPPEGRDKSRSEFNAEIKALNDQRKEYPQTPLKLQIEAIEQEIDAIDRRVERLQTMLDKTSLPQKIQRLIGNVVIKAKEFLTIRTEGQIQRQLNDAEKSERQERQLARYGRTFREGIHSQIREMKGKLETLHSREVEHKKYRAFVTMIETEVMKIKVAPKDDMSSSTLIRMAPNPQPIPIVKSNGEPPSASISKGQAIVPTKAKIPSEYKPSPRAEKLQLLFEKAHTESSSMPKAGIEKAAQTRMSPLVTTDKSSIKQNRSGQGSEVGKTKVLSKSSNPQSYKIEANDQTRKMLGNIQSELQQTKAQEKKLEKEGTSNSGKDVGLKGKFSKPESPSIKAKDVIKKVKAEAEKARQRVPPEYRARPYTAEELHPKQQAASKPGEPFSKAENTFEKFRKMWRREASHTPPAKETPAQPKPRKTMSSAFKQAASKPETADVSPSASTQQKPDIK